MSFKASRRGVILDLSALSRVTLLRYTDPSAALSKKFQRESIFSSFTYSTLTNIYITALPERLITYLGIYT